MSKISLVQLNVPKSPVQYTQTNRVDSNSSADNRLSIYNFTKTLTINDITTVIVENKLDINKKTISLLKEMNSLIFLAALVGAKLISDRIYLVVSNGIYNFTNEIQGIKDLSDFKTEIRKTVRDSNGPYNEFLRRSYRGLEKFYSYKMK